MRLLLLFLVICNSVYSNGQEEHLYPFKIDNLYGLRNGLGKVIFEPQFDVAFESKFGKSSVEINGKKGIVNNKGEWLYKCTYDYLSVYRNEGKRMHIAVIGNHNKYGVISRTGAILIKPKYDTLYLKSTSIIVEKKSKYGAYHMNSKLKKTQSKTRVKFDTLFSYSIGRNIIYKAKKKNKLFFFDKNLNCIKKDSVDKIQANYETKIIEIKKRDKELFELYETVDIDIMPEPKPETIESEQIYDVVAHSPEFTGGIEKMNQFISKNLNYPEEDLKNNIQGTVWIEFIVYKDGIIKNIKIVKGINENLDNEGIRIIKQMPKWKPGEQQGKKVNVRYTMPIKFRIQ